MTKAGRSVVPTRTAGFNIASLSEENCNLDLNHDLSLGALGVRS